MSTTQEIRVHLRSDLLVRYATLKDVPWVCWLHARNSEALGFIPRRGIEVAASENRVLIALLNAQPAAYILHGVVRDHRPVAIFQHCVQYDVRQQWIGITLLRELEWELKDRWCPFITCKIRDGHQAVGFWRTAGYLPTGVSLGGSKRMKPIIHLERLLTAPSPQ